MAAQYFAGLAYQSTPNACVADLVPPTFSGATTVTQNLNGGLRVNWAAATDSTTPITYDIFISLGSVSAVSLFVASNITQSFRPSGAGPFYRDVWSLADGSYLGVNTLYTLGVRARDGVGNQDTNLIIVTQTALGVLPDSLQTIYAGLVSVQGLLATDHTNFASDHTNFQSDHTNFVADDALFDADHVNFQGDHTNFVADDALFDADHVNFLADHANFVADDVAFDADHVNFQNDHTNFVADDGAYDINNAALAATEVLLAADHTNFASDHANFQSDHTDFDADHTNFQADHTDLAQDHSDLAADIASLDFIIGNATTGGFLLTTEIPETILKTEIIETILNIEIIEGVQ